MSDLSFAKAGGVVFEGDEIFLFINTDLAQAVGVGEFAETRELCVAERGVQVIGNFHECHGPDYSSSALKF